MQASYTAVNASSNGSAVMFSASQASYWVSLWWDLGCSTVFLQTYN